MVVHASVGKATSEQEPEGSDEGDKRRGHRRDSGRTGQSMTVWSRNTLECSMNKWPV